MVYNMQDIELALALQIHVVALRRVVNSIPPPLPKRYILFDSPSFLYFSMLTRRKRNTTTRANEDWLAQAVRKQEEEKTRNRRRDVPWYKRTINPLLSLPWIRLCSRSSPRIFNLQLLVAFALSLIILVIITVVIVAPSPLAFTAIVPIAFSRLVVSIVLAIPAAPFAALFLVLAFVFVFCGLG